jgi:hypothetical protein
MQYGMFYMHRCEQSGGEESIRDSEHTLLTPIHVKHTIPRIPQSP